MFLKEYATNSSEDGFGREETTTTTTTTTTSTSTTKIDAINLSDTIVVAEQSMASWFWALGAVAIPVGILVSVAATYYFVNKCMQPIHDENKNSESDKARTQNVRLTKKDVERVEMKPFLRTAATL
jgi:hypothetical protein